MSTSANRSAWAMASDPVSRSSSSPASLAAATAVGVVSGRTAMTMGLLLTSGDSLGLVVHGGRLLGLLYQLGVQRNTVQLQELVIRLAVLLIQPIQVLVVVEVELVDHRDTVGHRAYFGADAAADAGLVDHLVGSFGRHLEALVWTLQPALGALDAGIEVDQRPAGARAPLLVDRVARPNLHRLDDDALTHVRPAWLRVFLV